MATKPTPKKTKSVDLVAEAGISSKQGFLGSAHLIPGEDPKAYETLQTRIAGAVVPRDAIEEIWTRDVVDLVWESLRLRRLKAALLDARTYIGVGKIATVFMDWRAAEALSKRWALGEAKARNEVDGLLDAAGLTVDAVMAETLANSIKSIERIDYLIASAEARRHNVLREIERHRQALAAALRSATDEAVDAEFREIAPTASTPGE